MGIAMELRVNKVVQTSSGGDNVTIYDAAVELVVGGNRC